MLYRIAPPLAAAVVAAGAPAMAQTPPAPAPFAAPAPGQAFPIGVEVLSVDGERLGVLARLETRPGGERILHIRRPDGSVTTAPAVVAFRGERAVILDWTRAEADDPEVTEPDASAASTVPPTL